MNLPPSEFAATFRAIVVPKLVHACQSRGLFVALGLETIPEARAEVMALAGEHNAYWLPEEYFFQLEAWLLDTILSVATLKDDEIEARNQSLAHVAADIAAWDDAVHKAFALG